MLLKSHTYFLSQDALAGRATTAPGAAIAAQYVASQCRRIGLDPVGGDFVHGIPLRDARILAGTSLSVRSGRDTTDFPYPTFVTPNTGTRASLSGFTGRAVYVGDEQTITQGRLAALELDGTVAVTSGTISRPALDTLSTRGVVGAVHIVGGRGAYQAYLRRRGERRLYHADAGVRSSLLPPIPSVIVDPQVGRALLAGTLAPGGLPEAPRPLDVALEFRLRTSVRDAEANNVTCLLPGAGVRSRDTAIAFTAHLDHLGIGSPDASGDSIYNGFSDNAAGVAMLLAIAEAMAEGRSQSPRHSVLFLFFSGEEQGLLGSDYYVRYPLWPLERTAAVINLDAGAPPAPPSSGRLAGVDSTGQGAIATGVARSRGWTVTTSPPKANSDYFPFIREGVPAVFIIPGPSPYEGHTAESSRRLRERWEQYHRAGDEWAEDFPFGGLARYAEYAYEVALAIDRRPPRRGAPFQR
jgi:hypothetical protein